MIHFQKQPVPAGILKTLIILLTTLIEKLATKRELTGIMQITRKLQLILTEHPLCAGHCNKYRTE